MARVRSRHVLTCQIQACARSYPLDQVRLYEGIHICEACYEQHICKDTDQLANVEPDWDNLPEIIA